MKEIKPIVVDIEEEYKDTIQEHLIEFEWVKTIFLFIFNI